MKICIDAGHNYSGFDTGAERNGLREQDITFVVAQKLNELLQSVGVKTVMTRPTLHTNLGTNEKEAVNERYRIANKNNCDLFISIHTDSFHQPSARGTSTLIYGKGGKAERLAEKVSSSLIRNMGLTDRGIKVRTDLAVLKYTNMPAILVELAFISNPEEAKLLNTKPDEFAEAIFEGVCEHLNLIKKTPQAPIKGIQDIVFELADKKILSETDKWIKKCNIDEDVYWLCYKMANYLRGTL